MIDEGDAYRTNLQSYTSYIVIQVIKYYCLSLNNSDKISKSVFLIDPDSYFVINKNIYIHLREDKAYPSDTSQIHSLDGYKSEH